MMPSPGSNQEERFAGRVEAFSDLVFGFSLSLLAARLEVPPLAHDILTVGRFFPFVVTFAIICILWLEHYRVFRLGFVAKPLDVVTNFIFLFGIACLPYSLQTFMRFTTEPAGVELYLGDLSLIFVSLATLQLRALLSGRGDADAIFRARVVRRVASKYAFGVGAIIVGVLIHLRVISPQQVVKALGPAIAVVVVLVRGSTRVMQSRSARRSGR